MLTPYQFASNTPIAAIDLDGLERAIVINKYSDGKLSKTIISTVTDGDNVINLQASGNNLPKLSLNDILEINKNEDGSMISFNVRQDFTSEEKLIEQAGLDRFRDLKIGDGLSSDMGFSFPGSIAKTDKYQAQQKIGDYTDVPILEDRVIKAKEDYFDRFPSKTISDAPLAINPINGEINASPIDRTGYNQIQNLINLAKANDISSLNVNITMSITPNLNTQTFQNNLKSEFSKTFGYKGVINLNVNAQIGETGSVSISSPGGKIRKEKEVQRIERVQTGVKTEFKP